MDLSEGTRKLIADMDAWASDDVIVYGEGLCYASVCTSLSDEETDAKMAARPCGTSHGWQRSADPVFEGGLANPSPCERFAGRRHLLYEA